MATPGQRMRRAGLAFGKGNLWYWVWRRIYFRFAAVTGYPPEEGKGSP
ncbi:MAG: hypothetical protein HPY51_02745 [Candidatus Omnitrophica bacterium]|nr:hypothetical protein [Candidatus Omnitrophota bacterium]